MGDGEGIGSRMLDFEGVRDYVSMVNGYVHLDALQMIFYEDNGKDPHNPKWITALITLLA